MFVAILIGIVGRSVSAAGKIPFLPTSAESETVVIQMSDLMAKGGVFFALVAGVIGDGDNGSAGRQHGGLLAHLDAEELLHQRSSRTYSACNGSADTGKKRR